MRQILIAAVIVLTLSAVHYARANCASSPGGAAEPVCSSPARYAMAHIEALEWLRQRSERLG